MELAYSCSIIHVRVYVLTSPAQLLPLVGGIYVELEHPAVTSMIEVTAQAALNTMRILQMSQNCAKSRVNTRRMSRMMEHFEKQSAMMIINWEAKAAYIIALS